MGRWTNPKRRTPSGPAEQRVRHRLNEYFELAASFTAQQGYERDVPIVHVPYEVVEQWADWCRT